MDKKSAFFIILSIAILAVMLYFIGIDKVIDAIKDANLAILGGSYPNSDWNLFFIYILLANSKQYCGYQHRFQNKV